MRVYKQILFSLSSSWFIKIAKLTPLTTPYCINVRSVLCVLATLTILNALLVCWHVSEESLKAAVAQPDPSLQPRAAHTFSEQREGRD